MLGREESILLVVDIQGNLAQQMFGKQEIFTAIKKLIKGVKVLNIPIIWVEQCPEKLGETIPEIAELLGGYPKVSKTTFSCAGDEQFLRILKETNKKHVIIVGIEAHVCVYQTALDLKKGGYVVYVVTDATSSRNQDNKILALQNLREAGVNLTSVETALFEILKKAEGQAFKQIIKIVK